MPLQFSCKTIVMFKNYFQVLITNGILQCAQNPWQLMLCAVPWLPECTNHVFCVKGCLWSKCKNDYENDDVMRDFCAALNGFIVKCDDFIVIFIFKPFAKTYIYVVCGKVMFSANACLFTGRGQSPCYRSYGVTQSKPQSPYHVGVPWPCPSPNQIGTPRPVQTF